MEQQQRITEENLIELYQIAEMTGLLEDATVKNLLKELFQSKNLAERKTIYNYQRLVNILSPKFKMEQGKQATDPTYKTEKELNELPEDGIKCVWVVSGNKVTEKILRKEINWNESILRTVVGEPGAGKSGFLINYGLEWVRLGGCLVILDREGIPKRGGNYFHQLIDPIPNSIVLTPQNDKDPLIRCQGIDDFVALNDFTHTLSYATEMLMAGEWMREHIEKNYIKKGLKPTLHEIYESIEIEQRRARGREVFYIDSAKARIKTLTTEAGLGRCVNCREGFSIGTLQKFDVIHYDISNLLEADAFFFSSMKLIHFFRYAESYEIKKPPLFIIDEGDYLFSEKRDRNSRSSIVPPHAQVVLRGRKRGIAVIIGTPFPGNLSEEALNPSMLVCFRLKSPVQQRIMAGHLGMTYKEAAILGELENRTCLVM